MKIDKHTITLHNTIQIKLKKQKKVHNTRKQYKKIKDTNTSNKETQVANKQGNIRGKVTR